MGLDQVRQPLKLTNEKSREMIPAFCCSLLTLREEVVEQFIGDFEIVL
jgi:hypothetical protein